MFLIFLMIRLFVFLSDVFLLVLLKKHSVLNEYIIFDCFVFFLCCELPTFFPVLIIAFFGGCATPKNWNGNADSILSIRSIGTIRCRLINALPQCFF